MGSEEEQSDGKHRTAVGRGTLVHRHAESGVHSEQRFLSGEHIARVRQSHTLYRACLPACLPARLLPRLLPYAPAWLQSQ